MANALSALLDLIINSIIQYLHLILDVIINVIDLICASNIVILNVTNLIFKSNIRCQDFYKSN